jgi:hypothetical protein
MAAEDKQRDEGATADQPDNGHHIGRVAAIAAASGATAYAARKVLSGRSEGENGGSRSRSKKSGVPAGSLVEAAVSSGWDVAKDSLMPVIEDAATRAGQFLGERAPEVVRDVIVPRFISGFEKAGGRPREKAGQTA